MHTQGLYESSENYLETIFILQQRLGQVRSIDVVNQLDVSKASVSVAMKKLRESGHIAMDDAGYISLTPTGTTIAASVYDRHVFFTRCLVTLGVQPQIAEKDACRMEHVMSQQTFDALRAHLQRTVPLNTQPDSGL